LYGFIEGSGICEARLGVCDDKVAQLVFKPQVFGAV
jgi:hypothetical protein